MELKVICDCGQKYKFDVEPINNQMPFAVNCPLCGSDGTPSANTLLAQSPPLPRSTPPPIPAHALVAAAPLPRPTTAAPAATAAQPRYLQNNAAIQNNSFILGIVGAFLGAFVAIGLMIGFTMFTGMKFPLMGTLMGAIIGFGARLLYKGTDTTLGAMAALIAMLSIGGTLFLMFDIFSILLTGTISLLVGISMAWKIASG